MNIVPEPWLRNLLSCTSFFPADTAWLFKSDTCNILAIIPEPESLKLAARPRPPSPACVEVHSRILSKRNQATYYQWLNAASSCSTTLRRNKNSKSIQLRLALSVQLLQLTPSSKNLPKSLQKTEALHKKIPSKRKLPHTFLFPQPPATFSSRVTHQVVVNLTKQQKLRIGPRKTKKESANVNSPLISVYS
jgi:hypothetical protein